MRSREEIESLVREKIENLNKAQRSATYHLTKKAGERFSTVEFQDVEQEYPDMDVEGHKQHLSENFEETVKLTVAREIGLLLDLLRETQDVELIPGIRNRGIGEICKFTIEDIRDLKLDDPEFIGANFDEVLQSIYESYGFEDHLPTREEIFAKIDEATKARREGAKKSDVLRIVKEYTLMENARGEGEFTLDGLPLELREDCEREMDEAIKQAEQREAEEISEPTEERTEITGQELGRETLREQENTSAKQTAMEKLNALRTRAKEGEKEQ